MSLFQQYFAKGLLYLVMNLWSATLCILGDFTLFIDYQIRGVSLAKIVK
jgi:hypothetical protein